MFSAISFGVFWRDAPSTSAIMRSTKVSPGFEVMRTTMRSESTRVPPVTAERSPPDSRTTGADSPVIADSSTEAMPRMMSPSPGIGSPADTTTMSPSRRSPDETSVIGVRSAAASVTSSYLVTRCATVEVRVCRSVSACALPRPSATDSARFAKTHGEPQPDGDRPGERRRHLGAAGGAGPTQERLGDRDHGGERCADLDDEHDGVVPHLSRVELAERTGQRPEELRRAEAARRDASTANPSAVGCGRSFRRWWTWISSALPPGDPA